MAPYLQCVFRILRRGHKEPVSGYLQHIHPILSLLPLFSLQLTQHFDWLTFRKETALTLDSEATVI